MSSRKKIVIVAGDKSGDLYGGMLSKKLKEKFTPLDSNHLTGFTSIEIFSFGGSNLAQYSHQIINLLSYSVCGILEVLSSLGKILHIFRKTIQEIDRLKPDLIILIDFPDFNLKLAKTLNKKYTLFYYVSPQVWAWREKRVELIKKYVDKMIVIFKFEEDFYRKKGIDVFYFGHPLLEIIQTMNIETKKIISFLPGSRKNEIKRHLPIMLEAKKIMEKELNNYRFRIIRPENIEIAFYKKLSGQINIVNHSLGALEESEFIITSSGTATVEITIIGIPFLIIYKVNPISWQILRKIVKTKFIGMVNILAGEKIIEELVQEKANPQNIAKKSLEIIKNKEKYNHLRKDLNKVKEILTPYGAGEKFADFIVRYLNLP